MTTLQPPVGPSDHSTGPEDAPVTLVEYGDYQCPYCARAHPTVKALQERMGEQLRFVFRNFPLTHVHPNALPAAIAAERVAVVAGPAAFWTMHDLIFEHQRDSADALQRAHLLAYAEAAGVGSEEVGPYWDSAELTARVREDFLGGVRSGVNGTPTFFINGERFDGDWRDVDVFARALLEAAASHAHA
jgi:protein-disulfide isomerase